MNEPATNVTGAQSLIWTGQRLHPDAPLYNMVLAFRIDGPMDVDVFRSAFDALVSRTDALRTVFFESEGKPHRQVLESAPAPLEFLDLSGYPDPEATYADWAKSEAQLVFDVSSCLYRAVLVKLANKDHVWWLAQHHLITDGWAAAIVYRNMANLYAASVEGSLDDINDFPSFEAYLSYEQRMASSSSFTEARAYWDAKAALERDALSFYGVPHPTLMTTRTDRITVEFGADRKARLDALTATESGLLGGVSQFHVFATVLFALLARISGRRQVAVLAPAHNRPSPTFKTTAGLFIEVLPMHLDIDDSETFQSLLEKVKREAEEFLIHARPGTSAAVHNRSYPVLLNFINSQFGDFCGRPMTSEWIHPGHGDSDHSLRLQVHDFDGTGQLRLHFDVSRDVFDTDREHALVRHFLAMFDALLDDATRSITAVDLLSEEEALELAAVNDTRTDYPYPTVVEAFRAQAAETPEAVAIRQGDAHMTYRQLDFESDRLARHLVDRLGANPMVGIFMRRSPELILALWGVLKAGGTYLPIDSQYPAERIAFLMANSNAQAVLTNEILARDLDDGHDVIFVPLDDDVIAPEAELGSPSAEQLAYLMYTSGSTGTPKGVPISHASLLNYVCAAADAYGSGEPLTFPFYSSFGFDLTVTSLFVPLVSGGAIEIYPEPDGSDLSIRDVFADDVVDVVKLTPSHLALLEPDMLRTSRIRALVVGGEDLKTSVAAAALDASGGRLAVFNEYGPTETTVGCLLHRFDPENDDQMSVPVGTPMANAHVAVLGAGSTPVPIGVVGEISIGGRGLTSGYLGLPELTAASFVEDPYRPGERLYRTGDLGRWRTPGQLEFLGRLDDQVKIRGYRIELGEVEAAIRDYPSIVEAVVTVVETEPERATIAADIAHCLRCGLASNHPDARLNQQQVCEPCLFFDKHAAHADSYFGTRVEMLRFFPDERPRSAARQDCVMLLSGGKDSTYALYQLVEMGLTPLVFTLDNGFISEGAKTNIRRAVDELGLELVMATTPAMNAIFADSLEQFSNVCQGCFKTVYTLSMNLARSRGLRHIVTGLSRGQIFETRLADLFRIGITDPQEVDRAIVEARRAYHQVDDAVRRNLDTSLFDDDQVFQEIEIVDFYRYHDVGLDELYAFLGAKAPWVRPADTGRSTNCLINNTGIYVHKKERRFHNYALPYSWDVRLGHKTRQAALAELEDEIDVVQVRTILSQVGYEMKTSDEVAKLRGQEKRIVGYFVSDDPETTPSGLRSYLAGRIPEHMVPSFLVRLPELPLTVNGKIDRDSLPDPRGHVASNDERYVAARTTNEETLVEIWQSVLGVDRIGIHDPFIELGGDSILNIQVVAKAHQEGLVFTPKQLFEHQTIAKLATVAIAPSDKPSEPDTSSTPPGNDNRFSDADLTQSELAEVIESYSENE